MNNAVKKIVNISAVAIGSFVVALGIQKEFEAKRRKMVMDDSLNRANNRKDKKNDSENP